LVDFVGSFPFVFFSFFFFFSVSQFGSFCLSVVVHKWQNSSKKIQRGNVIFIIIQSA